MAVLAPQVATYPVVLTALVTFRLMAVLMASAVARQLSGTWSS